MTNSYRIVSLLAALALASGCFVKPTAKSSASTGTDAGGAPVDAGTAITTDLTWWHDIQPIMETTASAATSLEASVPST